MHTVPAPIATTITRIPTTHPYPAGTYSTHTTTYHATETGTMRIDQVEMPPQPEGTKWLETMWHGDRQGAMLSVVEEFQVRRNGLIDGLHTDPKAAVADPRHNYFTLFREMRTKYPSLTAGDIHTALKVAQQQPVQQVPPVDREEVLTVEECIDMVPNAWTEDLRHDCIVALLETQPCSLEAAQQIIDRTRHRARYQQRAAQRRHAELHDNSGNSGDLQDPLQQAIRLAIGNLSDYDANLITAKYLDAIPAKTIGEQLGISQLTFRKRLKLAEQKLHQLLQNPQAPVPMM